jgi:1-aminocyclopropane-1-carboxylate deaminase/D-cysteine desulfhydrase-like pyridoxal-dependent ACC family enzyme
LINENTPIKSYTVGGKKVYVKRDDLMGDGTVHPPWGKLSALRNVLKSLNPTKPLIHLSVYGSWSGWALSEVAKNLNYEFIMAYPATSKFPKHILDKSENVLPIKPNMMNVMYNKVGQIAREKDYIRLPYAFDHDVYIATQRERLREVKKVFDFDHLVVSSGSGVTCLGLMLEHEPWSSLLEPRNVRNCHSMKASNISWF